MRHNTIGWQMCCQLKNSSTSWLNLVNLKESHPLETAEYPKTLGIDHKPAFDWWVPYILKNQDQITSMVHERTTCYFKRTHKFGIEVPKTVKEALDWDSSLALKCLRLSKRTARMATPSRPMLLHRKWRRSTLPWTSSLTDMLRPLGIKRFHAELGKSSVSS